MIKKEKIKKHITEQALKAINNIEIQMKNNEELLKLLSESKISEKDFNNRIVEINNNINYFKGYMEACCDINKIL